MGKRKHASSSEAAISSAEAPSKKIKSTPPTTTTSTTTSSTTTNPNPNLPITIQIISGSYDRVLHGITATISPSLSTVQFADTFLFNAHLSAIRCLALSPPSLPLPNQPQKILLASGSTDERINLYHLSAHRPSKITIPAIPSLSSKPVVENPQNRELGTLTHHGASITALYFPNRSKLLSSAEDSTIAVTRTRDWSLLSTIKAPIPKAVGRPSGDTAPVGGGPSGVNDFAVHPSMKLMISVAKGEKSMRLWNLVTGKKAGVLNFERGVLNEVGEGKYSRGEGNRVAWGATGDGGEEFAVGFERGVLVYGMDCKLRCKVVTEPRTKIHQMCYVAVDDEMDDQVMALSTDDGRILFYSTRAEDLIQAPIVEGKDALLPSAKLIAQLGGKSVNLSGRVKDFTVLSLGSESEKIFIIAAAGSDGAIRLWKIAPSIDLVSHKGKVKQVGSLLGTYETNNRITCLTAFVMLPPVEGAEDDNIEDFEGLEEDKAEVEGSDGEDSD